MDRDDINEYVGKIKSRNKDLHLLFRDFERYVCEVDKRCAFPEHGRGLTYEQEGKRFALHCVYSIIANAKKSGDEESGIVELMTYCSHWACASLYSEDRYADTERAKGENSIKIKVARWLRRMAGE